VVVVVVMMIIIIMMVVMLMLMVVVVVMVAVIASFSEATELRESTILEIERRRKGFEAKYGRMEGLIENRLGKRVDSEASSVTRKRVEFCGADWIREGFHFVRRVWGFCDWGSSSHGRVQRPKRERERELRRLVQSESEILCL